MQERRLEVGQMLLFPCCFQKVGDLMWCSGEKFSIKYLTVTIKITVSQFDVPGILDKHFFHRCPKWFTRSILLDVCGMMLVSGRWLVYLCMPMLIKHIFQREFTLLRTDISPFGSKVLQFFLKRVRHKYTKYLWLILNIYLDKWQICISSLLFVFQPRNMFSIHWINVCSSMFHFQPAITAQRIDQILLGAALSSLVKGRANCEKTPR